MRNQPSTKNRVIDWIDYRLPVFTFLRHELHEYPTPRNLNYLFGSLVGITLVIMIVTGIVLAMHYTPTVDGAFNSVEHIMRDVNYGWLIRYLHTTGASMFFALVYVHIFRGLYYGSYKPPRELLWWLGVIILPLMMATAFFGYTLPWGQMRFWGATVITNLFSVIPVVGNSIVTWLWGGFAVGDPTLHRFYALHYLLPFVIVAFVGLHLIALHRFGSNDPTGIDAKDPADTIPFHLYYTVKDGFGLTVFLILYGWFVFYEPNALLNPDNSIPANPRGYAAARRARMVPLAVLRHSSGGAEQAAWRHGDVFLHLRPVPAAMARYQFGTVSALQADLPAIFLDFGRRLYSSRFCRRAAARRDLVVREPRGRPKLFFALFCCPPARRFVRAPLAVTAVNQ
jgi:quinol-cytochrome oxidoreductase complex cytochrome b subunit